MEVYCLEVEKKYPEGERKESVYIITDENERVRTFIEYPKQLNGSNGRIEEINLLANSPHTWNMRKGGNVSFSRLDTKQIKKLMEEKGLAKLL